MARRLFLSRLAQLAALPFVVAGGSLQGQATHKSLKIMMKSAWGSDDPTKAAFPFSHGLALSEAGHDVQIYLLGEAVSLMRKAVANSVTPVGWPPIVESLAKVAAKKYQSTLAEPVPALVASRKMIWRTLALSLETHQSSCL